jgi:tetratricopeptide (TPR) repeat protein
MLRRSVPLRKDVGESCFKKAFECDSQGNYVEALALYMNFLKVCIKEEDRPNAATVYNNMAVSYNSQGKYVEALEFLKKSLDIRKKDCGAEHPAVADLYNNMGSVYLSQGKLESAFELFSNSLDMRIKAHGIDHPVNPKLISVTVLNYCFRRNKVYYRKLLLLLVWYICVVIFVAQKQSITTSMDIKTPNPQPHTLNPKP